MAKPFYELASNTVDSASKNVHASWYICLKKERKRSFIYSFTSVNVSCSTAHNDGFKALCLSNLTD